MAFVSVEDLYGVTEVIVFDSCYNRSSNELLVDNIVLVEGRLSIREDDGIKIVANTIVNFENIIKNKSTQNQEPQEQKPKILTLDIRETTEPQKARLRGAIKFFSGEKNNMRVQIIDNEGKKPCGAIYLNNEIVQEFKEILGKEKAYLEY